MGSYSVLFLIVFVLHHDFSLPSPAPNIVFVLIDDVGWADFNYNTGGKSAIPTPNIDRLAGEGLKLKSHYVQSTCTPSRAALMTGRYAVNTGLPFAMFPGSVAGLPEDMPTMPQLLRQAGYAAHMVGKWHLGHSQWKQTPVGRGFESHTGSFMWDLESYTKLMWRNPFKVLGADWAKSLENGSYIHMTEPRHATIAITDEAVNRMKEHKNDKPLFLYVSYNAAHSPLQPEPDWIAECSHIPHLWRRQFCGMVVGLDKAIGTLVQEARKSLGENTVFVVTPDNGASVWFGGLNEPLRSGKLTPFEGGVRVPAFAVDLSGKYVMTGGKEHSYMFHISDWLPTFLSWAGASHLVDGLDLDGMNQAVGLKNNTIIRKEVLLELFTSTESHDGTYSASFRKGNYKIIQGNIRDSHWYSEPSQDRVATTDEGIYPRILENFVRLMEFIFGNGPCDIFIHGMALNVLLFNKYVEDNGVKTMVFDLERDPEERVDISGTHPKVTRNLVEAIQEHKHKRPYHYRYWMVNPSWVDSFTPGDCSNQPLVSPGQCKFAHPWLDDSVDLKDEEGLGLENNMDATRAELRNMLLLLLSFSIILAFMLLKLCWLIIKRGRGGKEKQN